ncbi:MAG: hypothetical protein V1827_01280 [Candidatus Micrarchaeota archaeon]
MLSAFNVADYLYPSETNITVSYANFTSDGSQYSIVSLNGVDTFLLKDGEPVSDREEIESSIYQYYVDAFSPSAEEITELKDLIKRFNDSRNNGYDFKNKEEYVCRDDVLMSNGKIKIYGEPVVCRDNESCTRNAMLLFSVYNEGLNLGSPTTILIPLMEFTPNSLRMDELLSNYTYMLDNLDQGSLAQTIEYISETSSELKPLSLKIESTIFRTPRLNDSADRKACTGKCWAICPSFDLDQDAAEELEELSGELADRIGPLGGFEGSAAGIYNRTQERLDYAKSENMAAYYGDKFAAMNASGSQTIRLAEGALTHVQNKSLSSKLDDLKSLQATIPEDIGERNFTNVEADMSQYELLEGQIRMGAGSLLSKYEEAVSAKNEANGLIYVLESKDLDPVSMKSLALLENRTDDLDVKFHDGMTLAQLEDFEAQYSEIAHEATDLLKTESETPATRVLLLFRGFASRVNNGIAQMAEKTSVIEPSEIPDSPVPLGVFSVVVFLSLSSMALLAFLYVLSAGKFTVPKTTHIIGVAFLVSVCALFLFSLMLYVFLNKTSTDATLPEFLSELDTKGTASIMVDMRNASLSDAEAMRSCASSLADSFEGKKSWMIYSLTQGTCTKTSSDGANESWGVDECVSAVDRADSAFVLTYSPTNEAPQFSVIYDNRAEISANLDYYESCPLVALFS